MNTRIAPSPTGNAHIGFTRTAYINYLAARAHGGSFLLRIDDTDQARSTKDFESNLLDTMDKLGLDYDGFFRQSERYGRYKDLAARLVDQGKAYVEDDAVKLHAEHTITAWKDSIAGDIQITPDSFEKINGLVLLRADGSPTYHFASCVDDIDHNIDWVIRGTDHIDNTAKHVYIYKALGAPSPKYTHVGLIFHKGKKISKRDGISSMEYYFDNYSPKAILNACLKMGWSHTDPNIDKVHPLIDKELAIKLFPEGNLRAQKATLDLDKLTWLNKKYK
jgi:glutamyl-tRNA synthetase